VTGKTIIQTSVQYDFMEFKSIIEELGKDYEMSFVEYCFIRSTSPQIRERGALAEYIRDVFVEVYGYNESAHKLYQEGLIKYRSMFYRQASEV